MSRGAMAAAKEVSELTGIPVEVTYETTIDALEEQIVTLLEICGHGDPFVTLEEMN